MNIKKVLFNNSIMILISSVLISASFTGKVSADTVQNNLSINRLAGANRYETSSIISKYGWSNTSDNVILATGEDFPDSLCAAPLAAKLDAPILLTNKNTLNSPTKNEITRLRPKNVYIIGGQGVVSTAIENEIRKMNINTIRVAGNNRYETSIQVAKLIDNPKEIFVTVGDNFPDSLSVASVAAKKGCPIILTKKDSISIEFMNYLANNSIKKSYIIGGPALISDNVYNQLPNCTRIYGKNRYETNVEIINSFSDVLNVSNVFITTGENFPDALSCSSLAGINSAPIILTNINGEDVTKNFYKSINPFIKNLNLLGGEAVVPSSIAKIPAQGPNAKNPLNVPTYEGSNQVCHPKVLYFENGWNGWKYWMVMTPYPNGADTWENPSIVVSNTGTQWQVPKGLVNPLTPLPPNRTQHNSDPHLVFKQDTNELELWYRFTLNNTEDRIYKITSADGIHWSTPQFIISFKDKECLSPAIIWEENKYKMWYIDEKYKCMYIESSDGGSTWTSPIEANFNLTGDYVPWHIDVVHTDLGYEAVFSADKKEEMSQNNRILFWNVSKDGINFGTSKVIMQPTNDSLAFDNKQIYRSSFVKVDGIYRLFYSAMDKNIKWHIGLSQGYSLDDLHGYNGNIK
ncbi:cell wall-binding repeat-containing protein [Candidatus Clostridium stratigraminis]|uniref:Cell wall-binding repeat-containing protein n=1 Tax=Candidatus Clostridium stratigraminis TaxID=3381661 RepID=A0ABW8T3M1_9CLOT